MQKWDTWEDIVKDLNPFLDYICAKFINGDLSVLSEVDDLKKVIARLYAEFHNVFEEGRPAREAFAAAVREMTVLYKMIEDEDKFEQLLTSETALVNIEKSTIRLKWRKHRFSHTKVVKCLGSETIEEWLERKSVEVSEARIKSDQLEPCLRMRRQSLHRAEVIKHWIDMYTDKYGLSPPPSPSPTDTRVRDNIESTSSLDESFVLPC